MVGDSDDFDQFHDPEHEEEDPEPEEAEKEDREEDHFSILSRFTQR